MVESINVLVPSTLKLPGILTVSLESPKVKVPKLPFNVFYDLMWLLLEMNH